MPAFTYELERCLDGTASPSMMLNTIELYNIAGCKDGNKALEGAFSAWMDSGPLQFHVTGHHENGAACEDYVQASTAKEAIEFAGQDYDGWGINEPHYERAELFIEPTTTRSKT